MKKSSLFLYCIFFVLNGFSQNRNNIWYFGYNAGIDFNTNPPSVLSNSMMHSFESCATICDNNGNLLFYTNGDTVFNRNHHVMQNGTGLLGATSTSASQGVMIIPKPCNDSIYYIFAVPSLESGVTSSFYSIVDITHDGGLGEVIIKNAPIHQPVTEKLTATLQANNIDYWIIVEERVTGRLFAYSLTGNGLDPNPVISSPGAISSQEHAGYLRFSHDGTRLCVTTYYSNNIKLLDFNRVTGLATNNLILNTSTPYGAEFSADNSKLYISSVIGDYIKQYDLLAGSQTAIQNSMILIANSNVGIGALKLAPNNKIYATKDFSYYVGVINEPNQQGVACNYVSNGIDLNPGKSRYGLPNNLDVFSNCNPCAAAVSTSLSAIICSGQSYQLPSGIFVHNGGVYVDTVRSITGCDSIITNTSLSIFPVHNVNSAVQICSNQTYQLPSGAIVNTTGIYVDTIKSVASCDSVINTIHVFVNDVSNTNIVDSIYAGQSYVLPSGQIVGVTGVYQSSLVNSAGCDSVITTTLKLKQIVECLTIKKAFTPNGDGVNDYWILYSYFCFKKLEVNVYNRYGSLIYHSPDYKNDWMGTYKSKPIPEGTYYYVIKIISFDGKEYMLTDNVTILR